jgi:AFG3 family protein
VTKYGMNPKIGPLSFRREEGGLKPYSEQTAELMDTEARNLINNAKKRVSHCTESLFLIHSMFSVKSC